MGLSRVYLLWQVLSQAPESPASHHLSSESGRLEISSDHMSEWENTERSWITEALSFCDYLGLWTSAEMFGGGKNWLVRNRRMSGISISGVYWGEHFINHGRTYHCVWDLATQNGYFYVKNTFQIQIKTKYFSFFLNFSNN